MIRSWLPVVATFLSVFQPRISAQGNFNASNSVRSLILAPNGSRLSKAIGRVDVLYKGAVLSTAKNTFSGDGIFGLGVLTVPGVGSGGSAEITVRAWDSTVGKTFPLASANGSPAGSVTFTVSGLATGANPPPGMDNFRGFTLGSPTILTQAFVSVDENVPGPVLWLLCRPGWGGECEGILGVPSVSLAHSTLGTFSGRDCQIVFNPFPNRYGSEGFLFPLCGDQWAESQSGSISIRPAPERSMPALVVVSSQGKTIPKLRGLNARRYRIERSADLTAWNASGEVVGNFSEVDLSPFLPPDDRAQFFRAIDVTTQ